MNRRRALQNLGIISTGVLLWQSCDFSKGTGTFLTSGEKNTLSDLANAILPLENTPIQTPDTREDFIETLVEVCYSEADGQTFKTGLNEIKKIVKGSFDLDTIINTENEAVKFCFDTTRKLAIEHLTTSEYFMTELMGYQFIPGGYTGCVNI